MADFEIYGPILDELAPRLREAIRGIKTESEPIELHVSSPGGILGVGVTCYNLLKRAKNEVLCYMDGDAFSAATLLLCAADYVEAPSNTLLMIHDPWIPMISPATIPELSSQLAYLKETKKQCLDIYEDKTGMSRRKLSALMKEETYWNATEAMGAGLVSNVSGPSRDVQNRPIDEYSVRDEQRLAKMLSERETPRSVADVFASIGDYRYGE